MSKFDFLSSEERKLYAERKGGTSDLHLSPHRSCLCFNELHLLFDIPISHIVTTSRDRHSLLNENEYDGMLMKVDHFGTSVWTKVWSVNTINMVEVRVREFLSEKSR